MRPCPVCGKALENQIRVCPECETDLSLKARQSTRTRSSEARPSAADRDHDADHELWREYLPLPLLTGLLFGGAACAAIGPWGLAVGVGVFILAFLFRLVLDLM